MCIVQQVIIPLLYNNGSKWKTLIISPSFFCGFRGVVQVTLKGGMGLIKSNQQLKAMHFYYTQLYIILYDKMIFSTSFLSHM